MTFSPSKAAPRVRQAVERRVLFARDALAGVQHGVEGFARMVGEARSRWSVAAHQPLVAAKNRGWREGSGLLMGDVVTAPQTHPPRPCHRRCTWSRTRAWRRGACLRSGVAGQALAAHAVRVAHRDGATVDVQAVDRDAQLVARSTAPARRRLRSAPTGRCRSTFRPRRFEHLGNGEDRANAHFVGLATGHRKAEEPAQRLQALLLRQVLAHHHASARAVARTGWRCRP